MYIGFPFIRAVFVCLLILNSGCSQMYFAAMEKIGIEKREIFVSRIKDARKSQAEAKEEFKDALEQYRSIISVKGGDLEKKYSDLSRVLERSESQAAEVKSRVSKVKEVSRALFREWKSELSQYSSEALRRDSERKLDRAQDEYDVMIRSMDAASAKLDPALRPLQDQVLYLKHNLNARAISALDGELRSIEDKVEVLINDLEKAIEEADKYVVSLEKA